MAAYQDVLNELQARLNRDDCTAQLAGYFLADATRQIQRDVHLPSMERSQLILPQGPMTFCAVPADLLELIDIYAGDTQFCPPRALERKSFRELSVIPDVTHPHAYARLNGLFQIRGAVPAGGGVEIIYYGQVGPLTAPTDTNELTTTCPDLLVYGALSFAGDHFDHPSTAAWTQRYQALLASVQGDVVRLDSTGGPAVIQSPYHNAWRD